MKTHNQKSPLEVRTIGEAALRVLSSAEQGTVLASVTDAVYLLSQQDELCWLIPMDAPMHQRGLKLGAQLPRLSAGSTYEIVDQTLVTDSGEVFDFQRSSVWKASPISNTDRNYKSRLSESLYNVTDQLLVHNRPSGLGCLIKPILQLTTGQSNIHAAGFDNKIAEKAWPAVQGIIQAAQEKDINLIIRQAKSLVGLGEGLTPSGDDFLGGFFYSIRILQGYYTEAGDRQICTYSDFIDQIKPLTNLISYTILKDHAEGHSVEPMHQLTNGVLKGTSTDELTYHAEKLISLGHSTGWDLLTGFIAGMSFAFAK